MDDQDLARIDEIRFQIERGDFEKAADLLSDYEARGGSHEDIIDSGLDDWRLRKFMNYLMDDGIQEYY